MHLLSDAKELFFDDDTSMDMELIANCEAIEKEIAVKEIAVGGTVLSGIDDDKVVGRTHVGGRIAAECTVSTETNKESMIDIKIIQTDDEKVVTGDDAIVSGTVGEHDLVVNRVNDDDEQVAADDTDFIGTNTEKEVMVDGTNVIRTDDVQKEKHVEIQQNKKRKRESSSQEVLIQPPFKKQKL